jgi:hypothetical protein
MENGKWGVFLCVDDKYVVWVRRMHGWGIENGKWKIENGEWLFFMC